MLKCLAHKHHKILLSNEKLVNSFDGFLRKVSPTGFIEVSSICVTFLNVKIRNGRQINDHCPVPRGMNVRDKLLTLTHPGMCLNSKEFEK